MRIPYNHYARRAKYCFLYGMHLSFVAISMHVKNDGKMFDNGGGRNNDRSYWKGSNRSSYESSSSRLVDHTYRDFSQYLQRVGKFTRHKKADANFPAKLHQMLSDPNFSQAIVWMPHGRAWKIVDKDRLMSNIHEYFALKKFHSFIRQLSGWGFKKLHQPGPDHGCYYHECFLRGLPMLTWLMRRPPTKNGKPSPHLDGEPDFYEIAKSYPLPAVFEDNSFSSVQAARSGSIESNTSSHHFQKPAALLPYDPTSISYYDDTPRQSDFNRVPMASSLPYLSITPNSAVYKESILPDNEFNPMPDRLTYEAILEHENRKTKLKQAILNNARMEAYTPRTSEHQPPMYPSLGYPIHHPDASALSLTNPSMSYPIHNQDESALSALHSIFIPAPIHSQIQVSIHPYNSVNKDIMNHMPIDPANYCLSEYTDDSDLTCSNLMASNSKQNEIPD